MITTDQSTQLCVYQLEMEFSGTYWFNTRHIYIVSIKMSEQRSGRTLLNFKFYTYVPLYTVQI